MNATRTFNDSGLDVAAGDTVAITAEGNIEFKAGEPSTRVGPEGMPLDECKARLRKDRDLILPAPGQPCWSLIGRVGEKGTPFGIGKSNAVVAKDNGALFLGVNDGQPGDNGGSWKATVTVTPGAAGGADESSSSSPLLFVLIGLGIVALGALLFFALKRRNRAAAEEPAENAAQRQHAAALVGASVGAAAAAPAGAAFDPESTDVNIFKVELSADTLDVGYNFFPDGTRVHWRIMDSGIEVASGEFVAQGGGSEQHFTSLSLDRTLEPSPEAVAVAFNWSINDVPFGYSVRREPRS
ncbi:MAG TPA: hypothetical protein VFX21_14575 [Acidimicrobiia bacterium]|nr:hypothetical protein [Acidimicrobiia bacterium]